MIAEMDYMSSIMKTAKSKTAGNYLMNNEEGEWKIFNTDGSIKEILTYRNGVIYDIK
jgi:antitoxin component YwqK of YwqJK toxin-antitoxin module